MRHTEGRRVCAGTRKCQTNPKWLQKSQSISRGEKHSSSPPAQKSLVTLPTLIDPFFVYTPETKENLPDVHTQTKIERISGFWHQKY